MSEYLTTGDLTTTYQVSLTTIYNAVKAGELLAYKVGPKLLRFRPEDVEAWVRPYAPDAGHDWPARTTTDEAPQTPLEKAEAALDRRAGAQ